MPIFKGERHMQQAAGAFATFIPFSFLCPKAKPFFVCLSVCAEVFDEFLPSFPELLLDPVPLLEVVPQNGDLANLKE